MVISSGQKDDYFKAECLVFLGGKKEKKNEVCDLFVMMPLQSTTLCPRDARCGRVYTER